MSDPNVGERMKAMKMRQRRAQLSPIDALWLADYEKRHPNKNAGTSKNHGSSRSARKVNATFQMEEAAEAEGSGNAAVAAATAALVAKAEGERLDALTIGAIDALKASAELNRQTALMLKEDYGAMFESMAHRTEILEQTHIEMLQSVRTHFLHATQAEGALMQQQQDGDPANQMLLLVIAKHLGIDLTGMLPAQPQQRRPPQPPQQGPQQQRPPQRRPPPNGVGP